ncbi:MAG: type II toxin-antitoxin system VapC family toxin [Candidatus Binatia bacterium]
MNVLLDTATFLWLVAEPERLSETVRDAVVDPANDVYLSAVSAWEIAVKHAIGRLPLPEPPERFVPQQRTRHAIDSLALDEDSTLQLPRLPALHRDPFDRMLICQAITHGLVMATSDPEIVRYPLRTLW